MICHIVVTGKNTSAVGTCAEFFQDIFFGGISGNRFHIRADVSGPDPFQVETGSRIRTGILQGAIKTAVRRALRLIFLFEIHKRPERGNRFCFRIYNIADPIKIVDRFRQQNGGRFRFFPPVAAYIGMSKTPVSHRFQMLYRHDFSNGTAVDQFFEFARVVRITQHMTDGKDDVIFFRSRDQIPTFLQRGSQRFFDEDIVFAFSERQCRFQMLFILCGNDHGIGKFFQLQDLMPIFETPFFRNIMKIANAVAEKIAGFCHSCHLSPFGKMKQMFCIDRTASTAADDDDFEFFVIFHHIYSVIRLCACFQGSQTIHPYW